MKSPNIDGDINSIRQIIFSKLIFFTRDLNFQNPDRDMLQTIEDKYGNIFKSNGSKIYGEFDNGVTIDTQCEKTDIINTL